MSRGKSARMWMLKRLGFVIPVFWGHLWWMLLLPRSDIPLHTVVGAPLQLPKIEAISWQTPIRDAGVGVINGQFGACFEWG
jgi:hypothetical protein